MVLFFFLYDVLRVCLHMEIKRYRNTIRIRILQLCIGLGDIVIALLSLFIKDVRDLQWDILFRDFWQNLLLDLQGEG